MWILIIVVASLIIWKAVSAYDKYQRTHFIPDEELWDKYFRTDEYVPWTYEKRMRYYNRKQRNREPIVRPSRSYCSYIETGYIHRRI